MPTTDHLAPIWVRSFRQQGLDPDCAQWLVELWLEAKQPLAEQATQAMQMRLCGVAVKEIQSAFGLKHHATVQRWSETALTRTLAPHLSRLESWIGEIGVGTPVEEVAKGSGVEPRLIETALHGWPPVTRVSAEQQGRAAALWRDGKSLDQVGETLGWSPARIRQLIPEEDLVLEPAHVTPTDLETRLGWSRAQVKAARKQGLNRPGLLGGSRPWKRGWRHGNEE
ncbi:hypothetical protein, partial [Marihabitans asiaticum]